MNLNEILTNDADGNGKQKDFSTKGENKEIEVYFKNIEKIIINKIKKYKYALMKILLWCFEYIKRIDGKYI